MMLLEVNNISKQFYGHQALRNVSFVIPDGIVLGLLGPNGAGKTTLIRIITRIFFPDEGRIFFKGEELKEEHISRMGYLPEERGLYRKMEVFEQLVYLGMLKGLTRKDAKKRTEEVLNRWDILHWKKKKIEELSKGMQQKVQLLASLLHQPQLLILDEPFSGFDPVNAQLLKEEILRLKKEGTTILFSSHNMFNVEEICDQIVLINKAEKILDGNIRDIRKKEFENVYEFHFFGNVMGFTNALWTAGEVLSSESNGEHHRLRVKIRKDISLNQVLEMVLPHCSIEEVKPVYPTLQEIFIRSVSGENTNKNLSALPTE